MWTWAKASVHTDMVPLRTSWAGHSVVHLILLYPKCKNKTVMDVSQNTEYYRAVKKYATRGCCYPSIDVCNALPGMVSALNWNGCLSQSSVAFAQSTIATVLYWHTDYVLNLWFIPEIYNYSIITEMKCIRFHIIPSQSPHSRLLLRCAPLLWPSCWPHLWVGGCNAPPTWCGQVNQLCYVVCL